MSHLDLDDGVLYPDGGFAGSSRSIAALAEQHGARLHTGAAVDRDQTGARRGQAQVTGRRATSTATGRARRRGRRRRRTADLHHIETAAASARAADAPARSGGPSAPRPGRGAGASRRRRRAARSSPHHTLFFTEDWTVELRRHLRHADARVPDPASLYVCQPSRDRPAVAPDGSREPLRPRPGPRRPGVGHGGVDGDGDATVERAADRAIAQIAAWAASPTCADRIVVRRTVGPGDFATDLQLLARQRARARAHPAAERVLPARQRLAQGRRASLRRRLARCPGIGLPMCLISAELVLKRLRGDRSAVPVRG